MLYVDFKANKLLTFNFNKKWLHFRPILGQKLRNQRRKKIECRKNPKNKM